MVTKQAGIYIGGAWRFVLAKKLMVTKLDVSNSWACKSFVLAKKLMVTKHTVSVMFLGISFVLAKKLMVTKPQIHITINLRFYKM